MPESKTITTRIFGRRYGAVEAIACDDAEIIFVTSGTITSTARLVLENLASPRGKIGHPQDQALPPLPRRAYPQALKRAKKIAVIDRNFSFGASGIFAQEVRAALCNAPVHPPVFGYIAGIGGRDVTPEVLEEIYWKTKNSAAPERESIWIGLQEVRHGS